MLKDKISLKLKIFIHMFYFHVNETFLSVKICSIREKPHLFQTLILSNIALLKGI